MHNMGSEMQGCKSEPEGSCQTTQAGCVEEEVFNLCSEPQTKAQLAVNAYCKLRSVQQAANECGMSESVLMSYLVRERDKKGLSDIRFLYADSEDEFNTGDNDSNAVRQSDLMKLIEAQSFRCALSGIELTPGTAALDHIKPVASGGEHSIENLQWLNCEINRMKGQLSLDEFVSLCLKVAQYTR